MFSGSIARHIPLEGFGREGAVQLAALDASEHVTVRFSRPGVPHSGQDGERVTDHRNRTLVARLGDEVSVVAHVNEAGIEVDVRPAYIPQF
ncbi:MAG: hypothetical protein HKN37_02615 [Rhodothermales bacterium]|nr:hypothetical protein [Rhodothermales bacterium]